MPTIRPPAPLTGDQKTATVDVAAPQAPEGGSLPFGGAGARRVEFNPDYREQLTAIGLDPNGPLPPDLQETVSKLFAELHESELPTQPQPAGAAGLQQTRTVDFRDLPPDKQKELAQAIQQFREFDSETASPGRQMHPSISQYLEQAKATAAAAATSPPTRPAATPSEPQKSENKPTPTHCARCKWPADIPWQPKITDADRDQFKASLLGARFVKDFSAFSGQLVASFQTLTVREVRQIHTQLAAEIRRGELSPLDLQFRLSQYRLVLSLRSVALGDNVYEINPQGKLLASFAAAVGETSLPAALDWLEQQVQSEVIFRKLLEYEANFSVIIGTLEREDGAPNF